MPFSPGGPSGGRQPAMPAPPRPPPARLTRRASLGPCPAWGEVAGGAPLSPLRGSAGAAAPSAPPLSAPTCRRFFRKMDLGANPGQIERYHPAGGAVVSPSGLAYPPRPATRRLKRPRGRFRLAYPAEPKAQNSARFTARGGPATSVLGPCVGERLWLMCSGVPRPVFVGGP